MRGHPEIFLDCCVATKYYDITHGVPKKWTSAFYSTPFRYECTRKKC